MKRVLKKIAIILAVMIIAIVAVIAVAVIISLLTDAILAPSDYLFYEYGQITGTISIYLLCIPMVLICESVISRLGIKKTDDDELIWLWRWLGRWKAGGVVIWVIAVYCCFMNVTFVTEDSIIRHTPFNPAGREYAYSDVEQIEAGFGDKTIAFCEYKEKGSFYYIITLDGREIVFHTPSPNGDIKRYEEHSYLELEEFDAALTQLDIPKKADKKGYEKCDFDKEYVDRFLRIIENK